MHILAGLLLLVLGLTFLVGRWLLKTLGVIKPEPIVPSGVPVGGKMRRTLDRDSGSAKYHLDAYDKQITITSYNGEVWRVLDYKPAIDNTYEFILLRVG